ncbi:bifunctional isocitrate dehydrogenase kinase/phosphatase [Aquiflexum gelatinilyticum]|uniref:Bifunctional isocitrate dehydrogenase kinase/phosphatase n=1 Tax=Aquiflexum gelatinilyticum TaxID=2961943 RepID=A0A9X2SY41_9BACT|nr:bifunctional isocitrate dehydrogenase kinase/phosphatase [Aquiflexum gelatinilyticum]MCR9014792.1 bifunctional isocitrate dehydrogenase kinase/phosphatase [Aquiflexum gelatinilyticum]
MRRFSKSLLNRFSLGFLVFFASCSFQKEKTEKTEEVSSVSEEEEINQLLASGLQQLDNWTGYWKSQVPTFDVSGFQIGREITYEPLEWPEDNFIKQDHPLYRYLVPNPEGHGVVDIYSYKVVRPEEAQVSFNPDSEVIYFKSNGMRERLMFMGPSGGFEDAIWVSPDHLMVAGFFEEEGGITPKIWIIMPNDHKYLTFKHPLYTSNYPKNGYLTKKLQNIDFSNGAN